MCQYFLLHIDEKYAKIFIGKNKNKMRMIAKRQDMQDNSLHLHSEITETILGCCFDVMNELGIGFLESVYKYDHAYPDYF